MKQKKKVVNEKINYYCSNASIRLLVDKIYSLP